jgi:putative sterol carrier protein
MHWERRSQLLGYKNPRVCDEVDPSAFRSNYRTQTPRNTPSRGVRVTQVVTLMTDDLIQRIEAATEKSDEKLERELPGLLDEIDGQERELVREHPVTFGRVVDRMKTLDTAEFVSENPETADQFQELLWAGVEVLVEQQPEVQEQINDDITVNFSATDCQMDGHLEVDKDAQMMRGGAGTLDDPMLEITGPADTLVGLVTGNVDPIQGFMQQKYEMDGPVNKGTRLAPVINSVSDNIPS